MKFFRKSLLTAVLFGVVLALPYPCEAAPHQTLHSKFSGLTADANFQSFDTSGCVGTSVFVTATNGRNAALGRPQVTSSGFVFISQFDFCTSTDLLEAFGSFIFPKGTFQIKNNLTSATLNTPLDLFDSISNTTLTVDVSLSWTGVGGLSVSRNHFLLRQPGFRVNLTSAGSSRQATASGSITAGGTNFTPTLSAFADLLEAKQGLLEVFH